MVRLPVSGLAVAPHGPTGADDLAIIEARGSSVARALTILPRLVRIETDAPPNDVWPMLTVTDFEFALLTLRSNLFGEEIACVLNCPNPDCGERVEIAFHVSDFIADMRPVQPRGVQQDTARTGWFRLDGIPAVFRLPTVCDQVDVIGQADAVVRLTRLCIDPPDLPARQRARIERAMEGLAPELSRAIEGVCPQCAQMLTGAVYVPLLVMDELRRAAAGVQDDVHWIASVYHWSEVEILALPRGRLRHYAERIRRAAQGLS
jgi:hypothetical protein